MNQNIQFELNEIPNYKGGFIESETNYLLPMMFLLSIFTVYYIYQTYMKYETVTLTTVLKQIEESMKMGIDVLKMRMNELLVFLHMNDGAIKHVL